MSELTVEQRELAIKRFRDAIKEKDELLMEMGKAGFSLENYMVKKKKESENTKPIFNIKN
ncbi:MAG: hypothetical protein WED10_09410 [Brumimicrobium sp.]